MDLILISCLYPFCSTITPKELARNSTIVPFREQPLLPQFPVSASKFLIGDLLSLKFENSLHIYCYVLLLLFI